MENLLKEQKVQEKKFKTPKKTRNNNNNYNLAQTKGSDKYLTKEVLLSPKRQNSITLSPSSKVIRSIGKLFRSSSPLRQLFVEKCSVSPGKVRRKLNYADE